MAIKYVPYFPNSLEGQALLNNFVRTRRTLRYKGNEHVTTSISRGMPLYDMQLKETVGTPDSGNLVIRGECVSACAYLKEQGRTVDLVYIDPPFASGADYAKKVYLRRNPKVAQAIEQAEKELEDEELKSFEEKMYGDIWDKELYLNWMYENLMAIKSVMSDTASIFVHLDWHIGHYVKVMMDEIFGEENFVNEIIWHFPDNFQGNVKGFATNHNNIFWYAKRIPDYCSNKVMVKLDKPVLRDKRIWSSELNRLVSARDENGNLIYETYTEKKADDVWAIGQSSVTKEKSSEFANYATQKPEAVLERVITAASNKGQVVADFFGGSGVTAAVAQKLGRHFIHVDVGVNSVQIVRNRLVALQANFDILEVQDGVSLYRNPVQTMDRLKSLIQGLRNEDALDKFWEGSIMDSSLGMVPVYLPNLMDGSTRILDTYLMHRIINEAMPDLPVDTKKVIVYYIDITDREEIEEFIRKENQRSLAEIELRDLKPILDEVVVEDEVRYSVSSQKEGLFNKWNVTIDSFHSDRVWRKITEFNAKGALQPSSQKFTSIVISETGLEAIEWLSLDCTNSSKDAPWHSDAEILIDRNSYVVRDGIKTKEFWDGTINCPQKPLRLKIRNICGDETVMELK